MVKNTFLTVLVDESIYAEINVLLTTSHIEPKIFSTFWQNVRLQDGTLHPDYTH